MTADDPEIALALSYASPGPRTGLATLLALDNALAQVLRNTREPAIGQMRLVWWRDRLAELDEDDPPGEPVLQALDTWVLPHNIHGAELAPLAEAWEDFALTEPLDMETLERFAVDRGRRLFELGARVLGAKDERIGTLGEGWALADLARNLSGDALAESVRSLAGERLQILAGKPWPRRARPLSALAHLARMDLALPPDALVPKGAPRRVGRLLWHRITGY